MAVIKKKQVRNGVTIRSEYYTLGRGVLRTVEKNNKERTVFMSSMCLRKKCVTSNVCLMTCNHCRYRFP